MLASDFDIGFTIEKIFLEEAWIYVMTLLASELFCAFFVAFDVFFRTPFPT